MSELYKYILQIIKEYISTLAVNMSLNPESQITATQANIDNSNQTASLAGAVNMLSSEFTKILGWASEWMNKTVGPVQINTDFVSASLSPQMLKELVASYQQGAISYETMWQQLQQGEIADPHKTAEEEQGDIEENIPAGMTE